MLPYFPQSLIFLQLFCHLVVETGTSELGKYVRYDFLSACSPNVRMDTLVHSVFNQIYKSLYIQAAIVVLPTMLVIFTFIKYAYVVSVAYLTSAVAIMAITDRLIRSVSFPFRGTDDFCYSWPLGPGIHTDSIHILISGAAGR